MSRSAPGVTPRRRIGGMRFRVAAAFALGGLVLVGVLAIVTYVLADHYLVRQRERSLQHLAEGDSRVFEADVRRGINVQSALDGLGRLPNTDVQVYVDGRWYRTSHAVEAARPPPQVHAAVADGTIGNDLSRGRGAPVYVVGIPLRSIEAQYFESSRLVEVHDTLRVLRDALIAAGVLSVVLGGLGGFWLSRRVLRPVSDFAVAAGRVAGGDLRTRLPTDGDRDLDSLATSFNEMVDSVDQRIQRELRFVADVSHELRSPITTLATSMEILAASDLEIPEQTRPAFELMGLEIDHLRQLVEDLLELSRADAGVEELELSPVEIGEFMSYAVDPRRVGCAEVVVSENLSDSRLLVDKRRLERVAREPCHERADPWQRTAAGHGRAPGRLAPDRGRGRRLGRRTGRAGRGLHPLLPRRRRRPAGVRRRQRSRPLARGRAREAARWARHDRGGGSGRWSPVRDPDPLARSVSARSRSQRKAVFTVALKS